MTATPTTPAANVAVAGAASALKDEILRNLGKYMKVLMGQSRDFMP